MRTDSLLFGLLALWAFWVGLIAPVCAAVLVNEDERGYELVIQSLNAPERALRIEPKQELRLEEQGMMRLEGEHAYSTFRPEGKYFIRGGVFVVEPPPPPAPETPVRSLPDSTGSGEW